MPIKPKIVNIIHENQSDSISNTLNKPKTNIKFIDKANIPNQAKTPINHKTDLKNTKSPMVSKIKSIEKHKHIIPQSNRPRILKQLKLNLINDNTNDHIDKVKHKIPLINKVKIGKGLNPTKRKLPSLRPQFKPSEIQKNFINFVRKNDGIGMAAHTAGSGKTAASIMSFLDLMKNNKAKKALVVVPAGLRFNYAIKGVKKFTNASVGIIGSKSEIKKYPNMNPELMGNKDFYVVSYSMFKKNPNYYLGITGADTLIGDEVHKFKDPNTNLHKVIKKVSPNIRNIIMLTATPAMNNPFEAVSIINAISKKKMTAAKFQKEFYERSAVDSKDWFFGLFGHEKHGPIKGWKNKAELGKLVGSKYHFATPELKDIPKKNISVVKVPMGQQQTKDYTNILNKRLTKIEKRILENGENVGDHRIKEIVNKVMAARQISNNNGYTKGKISINDNPKVLSMMIDTIKELKSNPKAQVLMFSNFIDNGVSVLEKALQDAKIPYGRFTGRDNSTVKNKSIKDYNSGKKKVLILSGAGAEGLDLPNTTLIQMMDGHYNPEKIVQSEARGIRRGGLSYLPPEKRIVNVKRYVAIPSDSSFSIDEQIYNIAAKKAELIKQFRTIVKKWQKDQKKNG